MGSFVSTATDHDSPHWKVFLAFLLHLSALRAGYAGKIALCSGVANSWCSEVQVVDRGSRWGPGITSRLAITF